MDTKYSLYEFLCKALESGWIAELAVLIYIIFEVLEPGAVSHSLWGVVFYCATLHISMTINKHQLSYFPEDIFPQLTDCLLFRNNFSIDRRTKSTHEIH